MASLSCPRANRRRHDRDHHNDDERDHERGDECEHDDDDRSCGYNTINNSMSSTTTTSSGKRASNGRGGGRSHGDGGGGATLRVNPDWASLPIFSRKGWKRLPFGSFADSSNSRVEPADAAEEPYGLVHK